MILIVDDKQENIFSLQKLLQLHAYEVDTASSGEEALKKILRHDYSLIILDVQMPGMDGYEVAETVKGYSKTKYVPIIFLSAVNIDKRFITKGYTSGGVDYITKPFDPDLLLLKVDTFTKLHRQNQELNIIQKQLQDINAELEFRVEERTRELVQTNRELEASNTELQQYASVASHDLSEPLRKIITFSNMLQERYVKDIPEANELMRKVISSTERMRTLIDDLLNYSKLSAETLYTSTDLNKVLKEVLSDLELSIAAKSARIEVDQLPSIEAIPGQIRQLFQNILSNALKFCREETSPVILIRCERTRERSFSAAIEEEGPFLRIHISDNGIGFNNAYSDKIFTIFQRLHGRDKYEGTGIGLAIVKKIVEKHHGIIGTISMEGSGSTFTIVLPLKQQPTPSVPHH